MNRRQPRCGKMIRDLKPSEVPWIRLELLERFSLSSKVHEHLGSTHGCGAPDGCYVTLTPFGEFFEIPKDSVSWITDNDIEELDDKL